VEDLWSVVGRAATKTGVAGGGGYGTGLGGGACDVWELVLW